MHYDNRKSAIEAGAAQYDTGKACVHDHRAPRYTASGTCTICVALAGVASRSKLPTATPGARMTQNVAAEERRELKARKQVALSMLVEVTLRAFDTDWPQVLDTAVAVTVADYPALERVDVMPTRAPKDRASGTSIYSVRVPARHVDMLRQVGAAFMAARKPDFTLRDERIKEAIALQERVELADWVQKP